MSISQTAGRSRYRLASIAVFAALFLMVSVPAVSAYEDDTHFWLTYYLSRRAGYTHVQSTPELRPRSLGYIDITAESKPTRE